MRLILKILAAPLVVALTLFVWICTILLYCTGMVLSLIHICTFSCVSISSSAPLPRALFSFLISA